MTSVQNPYGDGTASKQIVDILSEIDFTYSTPDQSVSQRSIIRAVIGSNSQICVPGTLELIAP